MPELVKQLIAFVKKHEPNGGYFGPETLVGLLEQNPPLLQAFVELFANATPEELDTLEDQEEFGWVIAGAADELDLLPDDPWNFKSDSDLEMLPADKLLGELCSACIQNDTKAVEHISQKIDVNQLDHHMQTALCYAVGNNHIECVEILLANGADPNVVENWGNTAMHICASTRSSKDIWSKLVEHGGVPQAKNDHGESAFDQLRTLNRTAWMD